MKRWMVVAALGLFPGLVGCEEEVINKASNRGNAAAASSAGPVDRKKMLASSAKTAPSASAIPRLDAQDFEFGENERSRDPFRSFVETFVAESRNSAKSQRQVVLAEYSLEELKLVGIVIGDKDAWAMLVDPQGRGFAVRRGQFIGRSEIVHGDSKGAPAFEVNWRIDRIREGDIVLVREDPKNPEVPSATRVIALRPDSEIKPASLSL